MRFRDQTDRQRLSGQTAGRGPFLSVTGECLAPCREQSTVHPSAISSILESVAGLMGRSGSQSLGAVKRGVPEAGVGPSLALRRRIWREGASAPALSRPGVPSRRGYFTSLKTSPGLWRSGTCNSTPGCLVQAGRDVGTWDSDCQTCPYSHLELRLSRTALSFI